MKLISYCLRKAKRVFTYGSYSVMNKWGRFRPKENLLIFSSPRGGSTWVAELIYSIPNTVILWEPLFQKGIGPFKELGFSWHQFIPEHEHWHEAEGAFKDLFRGKILNPHTCYITPVWKFATADKMIIKFCLGNTLLPWLVRRFEFHYDPVYIVRHPFSVVASQLKHGAWDHISQVRIPECRYNKLYTDHSAFISKIKTKEEALITTWCLTNSVPLRSRHNNKKWITVFYENLLREPKSEIDRIFNRWGIDLPPGIIEKARQPSRSDKNLELKENAEMQLSKWKTYFNKDKILKMSAVLKYFNIEQYDDTSIYPIDIVTSKSIFINTMS